MLHVGYKPGTAAMRVSQRKRKLVEEEIFGSAKTIAPRGVALQTTRTLGL